MSNKEWKRLSKEEKAEVLSKRREEEHVLRERSPRRAGQKERAAKKVDTETVASGAAAPSKTAQQPKWKSPPPAAPQQLGATTAAAAEAAGPPGRPDDREAMAPAQTTAPRDAGWVIIEVDDIKAPAGAQLAWIRVTELAGQRAWSDSETAQRALQQRAVDRVLATYGNSTILE